MRTNFGAKPFLVPMPVLILAAYDENGVPDAMNAAWGCMKEMDEIMISLADHKTTQNLLKTGAFTVSFGTEDTVVACDYVGIESANKVPDKFARSGFTATKSECVNAPVINELPMSLECTVVSYENEILVGKIVNVCADDSVLTDGKIDLSKVKPICYNPITHEYVALGAKAGNAFKDGLALRK